MGIFFIFIVGMAAVLLGTVRLQIHSWEQKKGVVTVKLYFYGIKVYEGWYYISMGHERFPRIIQIKRNGFRYIPIRRKRRKAKLKIRPQAFFSGIRKMRLKAILGTGDAAQTALCCGTLQTVGESAVYIMGMPNTELRVLPNFDAPGILLFADGIICLRIAEIIGIIINEVRRNHASD